MYRIEDRKTNRHVTEINQSGNANGRTAHNRPVDVVNIENVIGRNIVPV